MGVGSDDGPDGPDGSDGSGCRLVVGAGGSDAGGSSCTGGSGTGGAGFTGTGLTGTGAATGGRAGSTGRGVVTDVAAGAVVVLGAASSSTVPRSVGAGPSTGSTGASGTTTADEPTGTVATPAIAARLVTGARPVPITTPSAAVAETTNASSECAGWMPPPRPRPVRGRRRGVGSMSAVSDSGTDGGPAGDWGITRA